jgi:formylglycine-generating enzyme required for sulfatase activity
MKSIDLCTLLALALSGLGLQACVLPPDRALQLADRPDLSSATDAAVPTDAAVTTDAAADVDQGPGDLGVDPDLSTARDAEPATDTVPGADVSTPGDAAPVTDASAPSPDAERPIVAGHVRLEPGVFTMGSPPNEPGRVDGRETAHAVTLTLPFYFKLTEVTQAEWRAVMNTAPSSFAACGADCPVEQTSWYDAVDYCNALSAREGLAPCYDAARQFAGRGCKGYRLPTEAEWEFAARAGTQTAFYRGPITVAGEGCTPADPNLAPAAWYCGNAEGRTHLVGTRAPNAWGVHDVLGNVNEWVHDVFDPGYGRAAMPATDPLGPANGAERVVRGGSWLVHANAARSAFRSRGAPETRNDRIGFRTARWE